MTKIIGIIVLKSRFMEVILWFLKAECMVTSFLYSLFFYILGLDVLVCCSFWSRGSLLEASSLSLGIEARSVYIPPSRDPMSSFAICGIYWVWLLLLYLIHSMWFSFVMKVSETSNYYLDLIHSMWFSFIDLCWVLGCC
ncbi:hypothetical protein Hanom_Chr16g01442851 [Helianthus anomalus]